MKNVVCSPSRTGNGVRGRIDSPLPPTRRIARVNEQTCIRKAKCAKLNRQSQREGSRRRGISTLTRVNLPRVRGQLIYWCRVRVEVVVGPDQRLRGRSQGGRTTTVEFLRFDEHPVQGE